jgi:hypothetical protein
VSVIVLWLPAPPDNANDRDHWSTKLRKKKAFVRELNVRSVARLGIPPAPAAPLERAEILVEWHYPDLRWHLDPDNAVRRLKPAADWLVKNGYLAGDTADHVRWLPVVSHVGVPTPPLSTVRLTIRPLAA